MKMEKTEALDILKRVRSYNPWVTVSKRKTVISCDQCSGVGFYYTEELFDYHRREYGDVHHKCKRCDGDGRLVETIEKLAIHGAEIASENKAVPYNQDPIEKNEWSSYDFRFEIKTE